MQHKKAPNTKIVELLIALRAIYGLGNRDIANRLRMDEGYISKVLNGHKDGSPAMQAALEMLLELTKIQKEQEETDLQKKLSDGTLTVDEKVKLLKQRKKL